MGADLWLKCPICDGDVRVDYLSDITLYKSGAYVSDISIVCTGCRRSFKNGY